MLNSNIPNISFPIVEIFQSFQGEGHNTGMPAIFLRLGNCNLRCSWCDTNYLKFKPMSIAQILKTIQQFEAKNIIITGGEPTIHKELPILLRSLKQRNYFLAIETNGINPVPKEIDYIATSPKFIYQKIYQTKLIARANEVRIVADGDVLDFCQFIQRRINADYFYLSPCETNGKFNILDTIKILAKLNASSPKQAWFLSLQTHKLANIQ